MTEENTTEFTATVESVRTTGEDSQMRCIIITSEYYDNLNTNNIREISRTDDFLALKSSETVYFRIYNERLNLLDEIGYIYVVAIRTDNIEFVTLDDYNNYMAKIIIAPTIT